jgi:hypothetical protein
MAGNMTRDIQDGLIASATLGQLRNQCMAVVVEASAHLSIRSDVSPRGLERCHVTRGIGELWFPKGNTYHSGRTSLNFFLYHSMYSIRTRISAVFNGIVRPPPASIGAGEGE